MSLALQTANAPFLSGRNKLINGSGLVAIRAGATIGAAAAYAGPDRWFANASNVGAFSQGQNTTFNTPDGTRTAITQTVVTAVASIATFSGTLIWNGFDQRIEGYNAYDMLNKPATLSFWFYGVVSGLYNVSIWDQGGANSFVTQFSYTQNPGIATKIVIPVPTLPVGLTVPLSNGIGLIVRIGALNAGTYQSSAGNLGTWQSGGFVSGPGQANWAGTIGNLIGVSEVQLESGAIANPVFERRLFSYEQFLCQRYALPMPGLAIGQCYSTTQALIVVPSPAIMRATPSFIQVGGAPSLTNATAGSVASTGVTPSIFAANAVELLVTAASGLVAGNATALSASGCYLSAEL